MGILGEIRLGEYNIHSIYDTAIESYDDGMVSQGGLWYAIVPHDMVESWPRV